jgi:hypothetical protein
MASRAGRYVSDSDVSAGNHQLSHHCHRQLAGIAEKAGRELGTFEAGTPFALFDAHIVHPPIDTNFEDDVSADGKQWSNRSVVASHGRGELERGVEEVARLARPNSRPCIGTNVNNAQNADHLDV